MKDFVLTAAEWASYWDGLERCPHTPPHDNEKEYLSAVAYDACLAECFDAYARQQVEAFREQACRALCTFCDQLGRHNVGSPNEFEVKPEANGRHDIVYVSVYSSLFPNLCKATAIRGLSLSSLAATPHEDVLVVPPATPPAPASQDERP